MQNYLIDDGMIQLSVVVCTHNRAEMLATALQSLVQQSLDKRLYEILVVDNASSDATPEVLRGFRARYREWNIVVTREDRLGLGYARNAGVSEARGSYVAFMDDDARADKDWLRLGLHCFEHVKPTPFVVGGSIFPFYAAPRPAWFKDEYEIRTWGEKSRFLGNTESFSGSNIIVRKEIIEKYGGFGVQLGMQGAYLSVGEETILFEKIRRHGSSGTLYYSPKLVMLHAVPSYKMTISYQLARAFVGGQAWSLSKRPTLLIRRLIYLIQTIFSVAKFSLLSLIRARAYPTYQNWVIESFAPIVGEIGRFIGGLGFHIMIKQR
jgi:glycosyltransferase involved in cell wall biosynthesis